MELHLSEARAAMRIAMIRPNIGRLEHSLFVDEARMGPLELAVLAGLTPNTHEVVFFDDRVEDIRYDDPVDLAAVSVQTFTARRAYEICGEYRRRAHGADEPKRLPGSRDRF